MMPARDPEGGLSVVPARRRIQVLEVVGNGIVGGMETCVTRLVSRLPRDTDEGEAQVASWRWRRHSDGFAAIARGLSSWPSARATSWRCAPTR